MKRLTICQRGAAAGGAAGIMLMLAALHFLPTDPRGYGTHEYFGFAPCRTMQWVGIPCPFCGVTTALALAAQGEGWAAFRCQPVGFAAFVGMGAAMVLLALAAAFGKWPTFVPPKRGMTVGLLIGAAFILVCWGFKIYAVLYQ